LVQKLKTQDGAITIRGTVSGSINNIEINEQEIHAYVDTTVMDGRSYVAMGQIPAEIGKSSELLINFATPVYWLFATGDYEFNNRSLNGFALSGNRSFWILYSN
jgi:hypothetical protein